MERLNLNTTQAKTSITQEQLAASSPQSQIRAPSIVLQELTQDGSLKPESYTTEDLSRTRQERITASLPDSPGHTPSNMPR